MRKKIALLVLSGMFALHAQCPLVDLRKRIPSLCVEMRYATPKNITGKPLRNSNECYLCKKPARALKSAQQQVEGLGYCLKVWDAYQPYSEQCEVCEYMKQNCDDCNQEPGDAHSRGYAVDVTLVQDCTEMDMGSDFDDITLKAHRSPSSDSVSPEAMERRELLRSVMEMHGFESDPESWWHFEYKGWQNRPVLDIPFSELK